MQVCYIAGPYRNPTVWGIQQNIRAAEAVALKYWRLGYAVICPHKNSSNFDGAAPDETWLYGGVEILKRCDVIVMMKGWEISQGSRIERGQAIISGIPIIYDDGTV